MNKRTERVLMMAAGATAAGFAFGVFALWLATGSRRQALLEEVDAAIVIFAGLFAIAAVTIGVAIVYRNHTVRLRRLTEEIDLIATVNPRHRVNSEGPVETRRVARSVNALADRLWSSLADQEARIDRAKSALEQEKERLAALMADLPEGVVVCNLDGQILLYNADAQRLLAEDVGADSGGFIGLGRSVFGMLDRNAILNGLHRLQLQVDQGRSTLPSRFVATTSDGRMLRVRLTPTVTGEGEMTGFVLSMEDVTEERATRDAKNRLLIDLLRGSRASVAGIRAAIEMIRDYPDMEPETVDRFKKIIVAESEALSNLIHEIAAENAELPEPSHSVDDMLGDDLLWALQRRLNDEEGIKTTVSETVESLWLKVDGTGVIDSLTTVARTLVTEGGVDRLVLTLRTEGKFAAVDMCWDGGDAAIPAVEREVGGDLGSAAFRNGGEVWYRSDGETGHMVCLLLPKTEAIPSLSHRVVEGGRPTYYDFNLFAREIPKTVDETPLRDLTFTVFDTETTGLDPDGGDEIVSIGAVRIVGGRILRHETFDQLVDPGRPVSAGSLDIHGLSNEVLSGQPKLEAVLPRFRSFVADSVLVGHNAAFDVKFLQLKETSTGVAFDNPLLDTLLLAGVVHPNQAPHTLESIASLFGLEVTGRHTSLGDALVTAEIFLAMIPLLESHGIDSFGKAQQASSETVYARLKY